MSRALVATGVTKLGRSLTNRDGSFIFFGHRVGESVEGYLGVLRPAWLESQLEYLTRHFEIIGLDTLVSCFENGTRVPPRTAVLTFDDGFRDTYDVALPLLERFGVRATVFVVTGSLADGQLPWSQRLGVLFERTQNVEVLHVMLGATPVSLRTPSERRRAYGSVKSTISGYPRRERNRVIEEFTRLLRVEPPRDRMMTWDHAREAAAAGHTIGAHTFSHALLARVAKQEAEEEMLVSLDQVREQLGIERPHFCFPAGSVDGDLIRSARRLGFRSSFLPGQARRINQIDNGDQFTLSRVGLPNAPAHVLEAEIDGPVRAVRRLLRRDRGSKGGKRWPGS